MVESDKYTLAAAAIFGRHPSEVNKEQRVAAKHLILGIVSEDAKRCYMVMAYMPADELNHINTVINDLPKTAEEEA